MRIAYLAHPVRGDVPGNVARAKRWLKWLTESREHPMAFIAPWIAEVELWDDDDEEQREAGLQRCEAVIARCDELWIVGGRLSEGMERERGCAYRHGINAIIDLTAMGPEPRRRGDAVVRPNDLEGAQKRG